MILITPRSQLMHLPLQDTNTGNLKVFLAYVAAGVYFMAWCCKLEEDTLSAAMPRSGELQK